MCCCVLLLAFALLPPHLPAREHSQSMQEQLTQAMEKLAEQTAARPSPRAPSPPKSPPTQRRSQADEEKTSRDHEEIQHLREETRALRKENKHLRSQVSELEEQLRHAQDELSAAKAENVPRARRASVVVKSAVGWCAPRVGTALLGRSYQPVVDRCLLVLLRKERSWPSW